MTVRSVLLFTPRAVLGSARFPSTLLACGLAVAGCGADDDVADDDAADEAAAQTDDDSGGADDAQDTGAESADGVDDATPGDTSAADDAPVDTGADDGDAETTGGQSDDTGSSDDGPPARVGPDFRLPGSFAVTEDASSAALSSGCTMTYDRRTPAAVADAPVVILAHGFQANRATMANWATHLASWGLDVVTPDLCHATIFDADHAANGADLQLLSEALGIESPLYAGYSAGGLAAVLAAAADTEARAVLGLDMVDSGGLGLGVAAGIDVPALTLIGGPSMCNDTNNGQAVYSMMGDGAAIGVTAADHCDFQSPADGLCSGLCGASPGEVDEATIAATVIGLTTAFVVRHTDVDPTGAQWLAAGEPWYDILTGDGVIYAP